MAKSGAVCRNLRRFWNEIDRIGHVAVQTGEPRPQVVGQFDPPESGPSTTTSGRTRRSLRKTTAGAQTPAMQVGIASRVWTMEDLLAMTERLQENASEEPERTFSAKGCAKMDFYKLGWLLWIPGTILIVLSWHGTVSNQIGWVGFAVALAGVGVSFIHHLKPKGQEPSERSPPSHEAKD